MVTMQKCKNPNCNFFCKNEYCPTHDPATIKRLSQRKKFEPTLEVLQSLEEARKDEFSDEEMDLIHNKIKKLR